MTLVRSPSCRDVVAFVSDYLEHALSRRDHRRFERHLRNCAACAVYLEQMRVTILLSGRVTLDDLSDEALAALSGLYDRFFSGKDE